MKLANSLVWPLAGLTGLTEASAGLIIATIADNESATTRYRASSSEIETITTLGTYAAPTSGKCRFKEVDATNHPGIYEIQLADARYSVSSAKSLLISILGATSLSQCDAVIPLRDFDPYDAVRAGLTTLMNLAGTTGTVTTDAGNSATSFETDLPSSTNDYYKDMWLTITSGTLVGQTKRVTGYVGSTKIITVSGGFTGTPADGTTFALINR